jgi:LysM repeat protein
LAKPSTKLAISKQAPLVATTSISTASKKTSDYQQPSAKSSSKTSESTIGTKVSQLESNDFRQDIRFGNLEQNSGLLPDRIEAGSVADLAPIGSHYIVRPGDTLFRIAGRHGTSVQALRSHNRLDNDIVAIGQSLLIPNRGGSSSSLGNNSGVHMVKSGETFTKIAQQYGLNADALARANPRAYPNRLLIGQRLLLPSGSSSSRNSSLSDNGSFSTGSKSIIHNVRKGEHLGSIAKRYGVSTSALASANRLKNANIIEIGDRLIIPDRSSSHSTSQPAIGDQDAKPLVDFRIPEPPAPPAKSEPIAPLPPISNSVRTLMTSSANKTRGVVAYRMERGDTIDSVAHMFSTTTENIRALNQFPADKVLKEGNELFVPSIGAVSVN